MNTLLFVSAAMLLASETKLVPAAFEFRDTVKHDSRAMLHYRAIEFRDTPVQPLVGDFSPPAGSMFGQLPVGPVPETALAVVWLPKADDGPVLWCDANADGRLTADERHVPTTKEFQVPATITVQREPEVRRVQRTLVFRRPALGTGLRYAVRGYAVGELALGESTHGTLLVDGNADGCLDTVGQDRVWIDINEDGRFDGLTEQFPLGKPVVKEGQIYVIRSDPLAASVHANLRRPGEGKLRLNLASGQNVVKVSAELISDLGELVAVGNLDEAVPVAHGKYRVAWLKLQVMDQDEQNWNYSFRSSKRTNFSVPIGQETTITLLEQLAMDVTLQLQHEKARPSETVVIRPQVMADDGMLYLSSCTIGEDDRSRSTEGSAEILLLSPGGETINRGVSGFS